MECDDNGIKRAASAAAGGRRLQRKRRAAGAGVVRLALPAAVPGSAAVRPVQNHHLSPAAPALPSSHLQPQDPPFMNNMDEISYWIYTKRAPCLFNYDNILKKQVEQAQCSTAKPPSVKSKIEDESPRKKRKLQLLDDDSVSTEKRQNVYFKAPQNQKPAIESRKSDMDGSDTDFNIKPSSAQKKSKKMKLQKNCQRTVCKKTKIATSTPKASLRRSLRTAQRNLNCTFQIYNASIMNGKQDAQKAGDTNLLQNPPTNNRSKSKVTMPGKDTIKMEINGQFEDMSDVSGLTANYIRSTKMQSSKRPNKLRNQNNRNLSKQANQAEPNKVIACVNKSVNTGFPDTGAMNCSSDSSQNALKLVSMRTHSQPTGVTQSTSLIKLMEPNLEGNNTRNKITKQDSKNNLHISFQSGSSGASRYPRRHKHNPTETPEPNCSTKINNNSRTKPCSSKYNMRKGTINLNLKENSEERIISRPRSGQRRRLKTDVEETDNSVVQLKSSTDQVSSTPVVNVARLNMKSPKKNNTTSRCLRSRTKDKVERPCKDSASEGSNKKLGDGMNCALEQSVQKSVRKGKKTVTKSRPSLRDSSRNKSGFAACFSDSESDSEPLRLRQSKFFS
ncbi:uncharacterized protein LOC112048828 isoform X1 [Bicyclus anynana]|uniref:Uncharacterized protein LOC112048828 isoform X1 n=1 Tax=Bicyclus anynana TaxID=110368 RepID=A0A6J1NB97_BICAN|nr:uncharacterized protein LOC112048828 isoform X1 [Bicyclus anynana]